MSALSDDTEMVALGSRGESAELEFPAAGVEATVGAGLTGPTQSFGAFASAGNGPPPPPPDGGQPPLSGGGSEPAGGSPEAGGPSRANPWNRDSGTFGGFGLSGRNGRFLHGHPATEGRPGLNGRTPELNGRAATGAPAQLGDRDTGDHPVSSQPDFPGLSPADPANPAADAAHQNGRDEMSGRAEVPGYPTTGETEPGEPGRRRDPGDTADSPPRRQATGWASVPTSTNPIVDPVSGAPTSSVPGSDDPVSGAHVSGSAAPVSPGYQPPAFPYGQAPSSGVPAPRAPGQVSPPAFPSTFPPAPAPGFTPGGFTPVPDKQRDEPATTGRGSASVPVPSTDEAPTPPAADTPASGAGLDPAGDLAAAGRASTADLAVAPTADVAPSDDRFELPVAPAGLRTADEGIALGGRRGWDDDGGSTAPTSPAPAQRRSASLEDAEPVRRGRRAAPDDDDDAPDEAGMRPGDVAAGHITFWDDDATRHFRDAWHEVKAEFVDDPVTALTRAHDLLTDAVNELTEALLAERDELDPLRSTATPDTESMRMAMRGYREFLDRILAL